MRQNTDTLYASFAGGSTGILAYLFGGLDHLLTAFIIIMTVDYLTGVAELGRIKAFHPKRRLADS